MNAVRVPWSDASFLAYFGGLTILVAVVALLSIESSEHASGAFVGLSAVIFAFVMLLALAARRGGRLVTAGLYGLTAVVSFVVLFGALLNWFGWLPHANGHLFQGFRFWLLVLFSLVVPALIVWTCLTVHALSRNKPVLAPPPAEAASGTSSADCSVVVARAAGQAFWVVVLRACRRRFSPGAVFRPPVRRVLVRGLARVGLAV